MRPPACSIDAVKISRNGGVFISGWVNDASDALESVDLYFGGWALALDAASLARVRRPDTEAAAEKPGGALFRLLGIPAAGRPLPGGQCSVVVRLKSGAETGQVAQSEMLDDAELRDAALSHLAISRYFGNYQADAAAAIDASIAGQLIEFNRMVSRQAVTAPYVERFGGAKKYRGSIVVCLYGRPEYLFLQNAMFGRQPGIDAHEFIYVCNSPEIAGAVEGSPHRPAYLRVGPDCHNPQQQRGFGAANNLAAGYTQSDRVMFTNPDVFPRDADWILRHGRVVNDLSSAQTALFGAPLYYDDGSLMHGGMYFDVDTSPDFTGARAVTGLLRVEHYGKGAPQTRPSFCAPRPVPAVSGAFMSLAKPWFGKTRRLYGRLRVRPLRGRGFMHEEP